MRMLSLITTMLLFGALASAEVLTECLKDTRGNPLGGLLIRATATGRAAVETRTASDGSFSMELEGTGWFVEADPAELLGRGYFCVPGFCFPEASCRPDLFVAVPLRPEISLVMAGSSTVVLELDFDWQDGLDPFFLMRYRLERSEDGKEWEPIGTVLLSDPPIYLVDPAGKQDHCFYRSVEEVGIQLRPLQNVPVP